MKVIVSCKVNKYFYQIEVGSVFTIENQAYIKTDGATCNAVNLMTGRLQFFQDKA